VIKTFAPKGQTPVIRQKVTRDHLSVMGGMTPVGKVYILARQESLNGLHTIEFLDHLLQAAGERLLVIWDGSPIHRGVAVKEFVSGTDGRIWLEALPPSAPDLNPWDEGGWHHLKNVAMSNATWCAMTSKSCTSNSIAPSPGFDEGPTWFSPSSPRPG
jgi:transposase